VKTIITLLCVLSFFMVTAQSITTLPLWNKQQSTLKTDWLITKTDTKATLFRSDERKIVFSNGLVSRTFTVIPNGATVGLDLLGNNESFLRSVRPEAEIEIEGMKLSVGGLTGQPIHNYLLPEWLSIMEADPAAFKLVNFAVSDLKARFPWKKRLEWMPQDMPWPLPGKELTFHYRLEDKAITLLAEKVFPNVKKSTKDKGKTAGKEQLGYLKRILVEIHYELYDGMPVFSKWIKVINESSQQIKINTFKSEILAVNEPVSSVDTKEKWELPNMTLETDYNFGGMSDESLTHSSIAWNIDTLYKTQVNYERKMPCLLEAYPKYGPGQTIQPGDSFESFRIWELIHGSWDREHKGLEHRRMMRALAPWSTENPILMHVSGSKDEPVKYAIDQCSEVGFEMVIMTFGSGFNVENESPANLERMKKLADYAHSKGIALGGYSLLASRKVGGGNDVVMPQGMSPRFGNSPCLESEWGINYFNKLVKFYTATGLDILEHDGSYPGDICISKVHPGHKGREDSQWNQYQKISGFYKWCRERGIYLNVPDYYFLSGSNKTGMGYRETNWSLPREQQEIIERQNIYDGTWDKTPSMGWMFVPLVVYQGGGAAATIEPLKEHLPHYGQRLANLFGAGVQACYRGPQLYDAAETKALVTKWVGFYKKHRQILDGDIIHIRRPDGCDFDAILHVNPFADEKGLLMVYNPLNEIITRTIEIPVYYTGLKNWVNFQEQEDSTKTFSVPIISDGRNNKVSLTVSIPAKGYNYYILK
jgi:hypothetical protein